MDIEMRACSPSYALVRHGLEYGTLVWYSSCEPFTASASLKGQLHHMAAEQATLKVTFIHCNTTPFNEGQINNPKFDWVSCQIETLFHSPVQAFTLFSQQPEGLSTRASQLIHVIVNFTVLSCYSSRSQ